MVSLEYVFTNIKNLQKDSVIQEKLVDEFLRELKVNLNLIDIALRDTTPKNASLELLNQLSLEAATSLAQFVGVGGFKWLKRPLVSKLKEERSLGLSNLDAIIVRGKTLKAIAKMERNSVELDNIKWKIRLKNLKTLLLSTIKEYNKK